MRIVIDLQGAQTVGSRNRGIGRYSLSLAHAIVRNRGSHEVLVALSGNFPDTIMQIRRAFAGILPQENIRVWNAPAAIAQNSANNDSRRKAAEVIREAFLVSLQPDVIYITSLFEGLGDDAILSIGKYSRHVPTAVTLFDLIPHIYRETYLSSPVVAGWYDEKLGFLHKADMCLAISESSRSEGIKYLAFPEDRIVNVSTAAESHFQPVEFGSDALQKILVPYGIIRPFLMYTGGIDHRKNIETLIQAYAKLANAVRKEHQLAIVCSIQPADRRRLEELMLQQGLQTDEVVLTGFVPEQDLVALYNLCKAFVFPSWHEGFGLPALEAMSCGAAVIGANTSSLPEVIGRVDALFDPFDELSIRDKVFQVLTDEDFRNDLKGHGIQQAKKFSWDESGVRAIRALEALHMDFAASTVSEHRIISRPKLAYVSPLTPEKSGISFYSSELLPELARYYDITVIVEQSGVDDTWVVANCSIRNAEWLRNNFHSMDRILYHFGNSSFHHHMFSLLEEIPGVVVLHDFFLSGAQAYRSHVENAPQLWLEELWRGHGYRAVADYCQGWNMQAAIWQYPVNFSVFQTARGIIVHSAYSKQLAAQWYGAELPRDWTEIPLLRVLLPAGNRIEARDHLGFQPEDFLLCCFGLLGPTKQSQLVLQAWLQSELAKDERCHLVFVGEVGDDVYGTQFLREIKRSPLQRRIHVTGWVDSQAFNYYLTSTDMAIQLRTLSRGESSSAVLDCLGMGIPTIVNANGANAELPEKAVWMLPDVFDQSELIQAMESLFGNESKRKELGVLGRETIKNRHNPSKCAAMYAEAIEKYYQTKIVHRDVVQALTQHDYYLENDADCLKVAECIAQNQPHIKTGRQLLIDVSALSDMAMDTEMSLWARGILRELLSNPPQGYRIELVYIPKGQLGYYYARQFALSILQCAAELSDTPIEIQLNDVCLLLYGNPQVLAGRMDCLAYLHQYGVKLYWTPLSRLFAGNGDDDTWLKLISIIDGAACLCQTSAIELEKCLARIAGERLLPFKLGWFNPGVKEKASAQTRQLAKGAEQVLKHLKHQPTFLVNHSARQSEGQAQILSAFELLWAEGLQINLVIIDQQTKVQTDIIKRILGYVKKKNQRLYWLNNPAEDFSEAVYTAASCLLVNADKLEEIFQLFKAAQYNLPIMVRDNSVSREVASAHAFYFNGNSADELAAAIKAWMALYESGQHPASEQLQWVTWTQGAEQLKRIILDDEWNKIMQGGGE